MQNMYPGKVNSPQTELAQAIDDEQTTIPLLDASVLPAAPNLATIGTGEDAETILYEGIEGNDLTGVTRGFQGTAKSWSAGVKVARLYTAYDHDAFIENINSHASRHAAGGADPLTPEDIGAIPISAATSAATPNTIVQRDPDGRFKAAAPSASDDVARKAEVDTLEAKTFKNVERVEIQDLGETDVTIAGVSIEDQFIIIRIICPNANSPQTLGNSLTIPCITQHRSGQARYLLPIIDTIASGTINNVTSNSFEVTLPSHSSTYSYRVRRGSTDGLLYIRSVSGTITGRTLVDVAVTGFPRG